MRPRVRAALALTVTALLACARRGPSGGEPATRVTLAPRADTATWDAPHGDAARGRALVARFECNRCHDGTGVAPAGARQHCVHCHQQIHAGTFDAPPAALARWQRDIVHLREAPALDALAARGVERAWLARFVRAPHVVRPALGATMPRLPLTDRDARDLAAHVAGLAPAAASGFTATVTGDLARGRRLYGEHGCASCHAFTGAATTAPSPLRVALEPARFEQARRLAPDLRVTRERLRPAAVLAQIRDPVRVHAAAVMPALGLDENSARDVAAFVLATPLAPAPARAAPARLPLLTRPVTFAEVQARVLRRTCWHCHGEPDYAAGEGSPGNSGGFGFAPRGVNLAHYEGVAAGRLDAQGERVSILRAEEPDGVPRLVRVLLARQAEEAGAPVEGVTGMPLGLPALSPEEVQLVESWIAQGRRM